jgi:hypothetical protein
MNVRITMLMALLVSHSGFAGSVYNNSVDLEDASSGLVSDTQGNIAAGDDFIIFDDATIRSVTFAGLYIPANAPAVANPNPDEFEIRFYDQTGGYPPGDEVGRSALSGVRTNLGSVGAYGYAMNLETPVELDAGEYVVLIFNNTACEPSYSWAFRQHYDQFNSDFFAANANLDDDGELVSWNGTAAERVFALFDNTLPLVPDPRGCAGPVGPTVEEPLDIEAMSDISGDAIADIAVLNLFNSQSDGPVVDLMSGSTGKYLDDIEFLSKGYKALRLDVGADANQDGVANDPFIAVLAKHRKTKETWVQVRSADDGSKLRANLRFFRENYIGIDVAVLDDTNGDGVPDDPSVAVLAQKTTSGRQAVMLRSLVTGKRLANWTITADNQEVIAIIGETVAGTAPNNARISVLTKDAALVEKPKASILSIRVADGSLLPRQTVVGSSWKVVDMAVRKGGAGSGATNAPAIVVLGEQLSNSTSKVRVRDLKRNDKLTDITILGSPWNSHRVGVAPDLSGNGEEEAVVLAIHPADDRVRIKLRDLDSGDNVGTFDEDDF